MTPLESRLSSALSDRYQIDREIGQGGMATVYLAQDLKHDRKVALKVLRPELAAVIGAERFLAEIKTTASLQHPHILPLFDSGAADSFLFYVMPYVEGESLRDRLNREKQLPIGDAVRIATEAAGALDYAHRHGVIHRDIKPENILLHDGRALVADFGIALAVSTAGSRMTETGMSLGTPHYMSPEQAMGEREITARSDVYALGCVLYEMLVGEPPFTGPTAQAIVAKVVTEEPRPLLPKRHTIPAHVEAAVLTALEKTAADRFGSAADFAAALAGQRGTAPGTTRARSAAAAAGAGVPRLWFLATLALSVVLVVATLIGWWRSSPVPATSRQRVVLWQFTLPAFLSPGVERHATQAAIAPDGSSIVFTDSTADGFRLMRKLRQDPDPGPLAGTEGAVSPFFSPDGSWIGYVTTDGKLRKVPASGGGAITLTEQAHLVYTSAAWLDDGTIVFMDKDIALRRIPADGGTATVVRGADPNRRLNVATISPLPGSRGVLYSACPGNCGIESSVYVFDFSADSSRLLVAGAAGAWYSPTGHLLYTDRAGGLYAAGFDPKRLALTSGAVPVIDGVEPATFAMSVSGAVLYSIGIGGGASSELVWVSRNGTAEPVDPGWKGRFEYPALSPDGKAIAVSLQDGPTHLWIRRADGTRQRLTQGGTVNWRPSWTPDGRSVAYLSNASGDRGKDELDVYLVRADGSAPAQRLLTHTFGLWEAEFSKDGQWLVVRADEAGGNGNIRARRLSGDTALVPLLVDQEVTTQVALSPDGRWMAYVSDASGRREVYVASFPDMSTRRLVSRDGGLEPRWSHSGRELFYKSRGQLIALPVPPGPVFTPGLPRPLFSLQGYVNARNRQQYDVAPDDRRFLMIRAIGGQNQAVYAENWLPELKAKVKR